MFSLGRRPLKSVHDHQRCACQSPLPNARRTQRRMGWSTDRQVHVFVFSPTSSFPSDAAFLPFCTLVGFSSTTGGWFWFRNASTCVGTCRTAVLVGVDLRPNPPRRSPTNLDHTWSRSPRGDGGGPTVQMRSTGGGPGRRQGEGRVERQTVPAGSWTGGDARVREFDRNSTRRGMRGFESLKCRRRVQMDSRSPAPNRASLQNRMDHVNDKYAPCMDPTIV